MNTLVYFIGWVPFVSSNICNDIKTSKNMLAYLIQLLPVVKDAESSSSTANRTMHINLMNMQQAEHNSKLLLFYTKKHTNEMNETQSLRMQ